MEKHIVKKVNVKDGQNEKLLFELDAPDAVGTTKIDIDFKSSKYSFKRQYRFKC